MEAATPLPIPQVRILGDRMRIDGLTVDDECVVRLARERADAGEDLGRLVADAIEIGARVLDREQTGTEVALLRQELERTSEDVGRALEQNATKVTQELSAKVVELFGPETGHVTRVLARHFSDDSTGAVQHRVKAAIEEVMTSQRDLLRRQFTSTGGDNPLAAFQKAAVESIDRASAQQGQHLREMQRTIAGLQIELAKLQAEKAKLEAVEAEADRGTAKGRSYEEAVFEALDAIAVGQGDDCDAVGDVKGVGGKKGDVVVGIDACAGPPRGRIVFEAKNSKLSKKQALAELDEARVARDADYAVFVVPSEDKLPARTHPLREHNGDKLFVVYDPEDGSRLALEVAYALGRARVLMKRGGGEGVDAAALRAEVEKAVTAMEDVRRVKSQLTQATTSIGEAAKLVDAMAATVRAHLVQIDGLLDAASPEVATAAPAIAPAPAGAIAEVPPTTSPEIHRREERRAEAGAAPGSLFG
jgi:hypothetical protein